MNGDMRRIARVRRSRGGFTLLELIVVIVILAILVAIAVPVYTLQTNRARVVAAKAGLKQIQSSEQLFRLENNVYTAALTSPPLDIAITNSLDFAYTVAIALPGTGTATGTGTANHPAITDIVNINLTTGAFTCAGALAAAGTVCIGD